MTSGSRAGGDAARDALAERNPGPADLVAIEAVRRGEGQVGSVPIEQVERGDVGVERIAGPVDDRLEELVPRPRRRREAGDLMQEPELLELIRSAPRVDLGRRHGRHDTSLRADRAAERLRQRAGPAAERSRRNLRDNRSARLAPARPSRAIRTRPSAPSRPTIGTGRARDPLALEVRLLGSLLGQVIAEQAGRELLDLVERVRRTTIRLRRGDDPALRSRSRRRARGARARSGRGRRSARSACTSGSSTSPRSASWSGRPGARDRRDRASAGARPSAGERARRLAARRRRLAAPIRRERGRRSRPPSPRSGSRPVLTAHPTEARRRTVLIALRRIDRLLGRLADRDIAAAEDRDARRRLREEITLLWRTADLRATRRLAARRGPDGARLLRRDRSSASCRGSTARPMPRWTPAARDAAARPAPTERRRGEPMPAGPGPGRRASQPFLAWESWIGGDRDGNPSVTAEITERTLRIHADHVLRGYEAVATRLAADDRRRRRRPTRRPGPRDPPRAATPSSCRTSIAQLRRRYPDEPYRQRFGFIAERLRRTRAHLTGQAAPLTGRYADADELDAELAEIQDALVADGLGRVAWGEVADLRWQVATFGFHLAALEVRQHSAVHRAAEAALGAGDAGSRGRAGRDARRRSSRRSGPWPRLQARFGPRRGRPLRHLVHRPRPAT